MKPKTMLRRAILEWVLKFLSAGLPLLICSCLLPLPATAASKVTEVLRQKLGHVVQPRMLWVGCETIHTQEDLVQFYKDRQFAPFWVNEQGLNALGKDLPSQLAEARLHGLDPEDYHLRCINATITELNAISLSPREPTAQALADLDILMTDAFMIYASHLTTGKVDPESLYPLWFSQKEKANIISGMNRLVRSKDLAETIKSFAPSHRQYWDLIDAAQQMESIIAAGGWPMLSQGRTLRPGDRDPRVAMLRYRLKASGDLGSSEPDGQPDKLDETVELAVKKFQLRHGLAVDGVVGPNTLRELNIPAENRRQQILLNLERWRWLPHEWSKNYVIVNTAAFTLSAHRASESLSMRVIVGKDYQKTPVFSEAMRYIEINPYWNVPHSIAVKEMLPKIKRNPGYLANNNYQLLSGGSVINPWHIDWQNISSNNFPGRIRQKPGTRNALGRIKFMFPNRFNVYMHDTPDRHLFQRARRAFSHGCIRVQEPVELALLMLKDDPGWTRERLENAIASGKRRVININSDWMVHILYWTAWVDGLGQLQFCPDIYERDRILWQALNKKTRRATVASSAAVDTATN